MSIKKSHKKKSEPIQKKGIVIIGNMSVGKTSLFEAICKKGATVMNVAGNTVSVKAGDVRGKQLVLMDTPGIYSVFTSNEDEKISRDILLARDTDIMIHGILLVADAKNMKRSIAIALQYAEFGLPILLNINMIDETAVRGITIFPDKLSEILGIDVVSTVASDGIGVKAAVDHLSCMKTMTAKVLYPDWVEAFLEKIICLMGEKQPAARIIGLLLLTGDAWIEGYIKETFGSGMLERIMQIRDMHQQQAPNQCSLLFANLYNKKAEYIANQVQSIAPPLKSPFIQKFGDWCSQLFPGIPIAVLALYLMYLFVGKFGATFLVDALNNRLFSEVLIPLTTEFVAPIPSPFVRDMIVDPDFGILPTGVFLALGLVLPVLLCFYIAFGILEDSGYLSRLSVLLNRLFQKMGLNGKGVIPLIMGFSCVTMAILTTRMLDTKKEKNIATFLLLLGMPCAPLLAVMFIILGNMPISASITVFGIIFLQITVTGFIANKILPGRQAPFFMEISPMRVPKLRQIVKTAIVKTYFFMKEAVPVFIMASAIVFLFERIGGLAFLEKAAAPVINGFMGLPEKSVQVFIKTIVRRENGATEIQHLSGIYTNLQLVVNLLVMTSLTPCMNATIVLFKERGIRTGAIIIGVVMTYALIVGAGVNHLCRFLGIYFT